MSRNAHGNICGHSTFVKGAFDMINLIKGVDRVGRISGGKYNLIVLPKHRQGVVIVETHYCLRLDYHGNEGSQTFQIFPKKGVTIHDLRENVSSALKRKYHLIDRKNVQSRREKDVPRKPFEIEKDEFYPLAYRVLRDKATIDESGRMIVTDIRTLLDRGLPDDSIYRDSKYYDRIQNNRNVLKKVGTQFVNSDRSAKGTRRNRSVYQLTNLDDVFGYPTKENNVLVSQEPVETDLVDNVDNIEIAVQVPDPLPLDLFPEAMEALWASLEEEIRKDQEELANLEQKRSDLMNQMNIVETNISGATSSISAKKAKIERILKALEEFRTQR